MHKTKAALTGGFCYGIMKTINLFQIWQEAEHDKEQEGNQVRHDLSFVISTRWLRCRLM